MKRFLIALLVVMSLAGCSDINLKLLTTDYIKCEVTRMYREGVSDEAYTFHSVIHDDEFNADVILNLTPNEYGQIKVGNILEIERKQLLDKYKNEYHYRYSLTYTELLKDSESKTEEIYVVITDKFNVLHTGKINYTSYHVVFTDTELENRGNEERITYNIYNKINIGEKYVAIRTTKDDEEGNKHYTYKLKQTVNDGD